MTAGELAALIVAEFVLALLAIVFLVKAALAMTNAIECRRDRRRSASSGDIAGSN